LPFSFSILLVIKSGFRTFAFSSLFALCSETPGSLHFALCSSLARGTACAEDEDGKHEMKRAPAAITSLSAASRCASRPPSDPSV
jgi:hypothetical protein